MYMYIKILLFEFCINSNMFAWICTFDYEQNSWGEQEKILKQECERFEQRCEELTSQNNILHQQMEKVCLFKTYKILFILNKTFKGQYFL